MAMTQRGREMQRLLGQCERSGLSLAEFARRRGLSAQALRWWRHRLRGLEADSAPEFVEVDLAAASSAACFEVVLPTGEVVRVGERFDAGALTRLLAVLRGSC